ncbi:formamidase [Legionella resiliens]|uniref:Acetamidase/formamidase family protein n=1 Tax=Legionella resiliens TaxID=2905958 RepID=A0ABS8X267_9GAMM|nr:MULTISPECIES: formamidase [unclassified Legionella]MCE0722569.1 acetamidase/formamidase family protein [Legionella sp. 9fVS26]MCE3531722.1 acetamidase/formamidase family protein [Legionella sp. 8cVS16]
MPKTIITVDLNKKPHEQPYPLHNRWHPDIPAVATVKPGDIFRVECLDWTGGQIKNNDNADDIKFVDLTQVHYLSGPIAVQGARPGDILVVEILDIGALEGAEWGFSGIFAHENGGGFLTDHFPNAAKAIWDFEGAFTSSRHIPGVRFPGILHPGLIGCAPSHELLAQWNQREEALKMKDPTRIPPYAELPQKKGALLGTCAHNNYEKIAHQAARTIPPRENGGNCDIKNLTKGSRIFFPVFIEDAHLSVGDIHFSQGDGEISFCGGIEMAGWIVLKVDLIPQGCKKYSLKNPLFYTPSLEPHYSRYLIFEGISVDEKGKQYYLDATIAYKQACLNAIEYLKTKMGLSGEQAYLLLSAAPIEGRISGIVDIPNACCTLALPLDIFTSDIMPR